jgi:acetyltransferase-like isoleucine patch superfamily enzyme
MIEYKFNQKEIKSLGLNLDLLNVQRELMVSSPVSLQNCVVKGKCKVGAFTYFGKSCEIRDSDIGNYCSISAEVIINPMQHPLNYLSTHSFVFGDNGGFRNVESFGRVKTQPVYKVARKRVEIGHDVWIGRRVIIMGGVNIGNGAVIAANSVVTKDVPPYAVVGGVPSRVIKYRFEEDMIDVVVRSNWFNYVMDKSILGVLDYSNLHESLPVIEECIRSQRLQEIRLNILIDRINKCVSLLG